MKSYKHHRMVLTGRMICVHTVTAEAPSPGVLQAETRPPVIERS